MANHQGGGASAAAALEYTPIVAEILRPILPLRLNHPRLTMI